MALSYSQVLQNMISLRCPCFHFEKYIIFPSHRRKSLWWILHNHEYRGIIMTWVSSKKLVLHNPSESLTFTRFLSINQTQRHLNQSFYPAWGGSGGGFGSLSASSAKCWSTSCSKSFWKGSESCPATIWTTTKESQKMTKSLSRSGEKLTPLGESPHVCCLESSCFIDDSSKISKFQGI